MRIKRLAVLAVLISVGLVLGVIEAKIPIFTALPGAKIGISNIVTLISVYLLGPVPTFLIAILKSLLVSFFCGAPTSFLYSGTGAALSVLVMLLTKNILKDKVSAVGVSILGAASVNLAQTVVAAIIVNNISMLAYLPPLFVISAFSGLITGLAANGIMGVIKNV